MQHLHTIHSMRSRQERNSVGTVLKSKPLWEKGLSRVEISSLISEKEADPKRKPRHKLTPTIKPYFLVKSLV